MRNDLHRTSAVVPVPFLVENRPVYFSARHVGIEVQVLIDEALIMPQIQVCLRPVIGHKDLSVLDGVHGSRVHIQIWIQLLHGHMIPSCLEQASERGSRDSFSKTGDDTSGDKYVPGHSFLLSVVSLFPEFPSFRSQDARIRMPE